MESNNVAKFKFQEEDNKDVSYNLYLNLNNELKKKKKKRNDSIKIITLNRRVECIMVKCPTTSLFSTHSIFIIIISFYVQSHIFLTLLNERKKILLFYFFRFSLVWHSSKFHLWGLFFLFFFYSSVNLRSSPSLALQKSQASRIQKCDEQQKVMSLARFINLFIVHYSHHHHSWCGTVAKNCTIITSSK